MENKSYVLYQGTHKISVKCYEELQRKHKTAACYYHHWCRKVLELSRIVYPDSKWGYWAYFNLPFKIFIGYDLVKEQVEYEYETKELIKLYHKLKLKKWNIKP